MSNFNQTLPIADGSEEPVSEFLFDSFLQCNIQNHTTTTTIPDNATAAPAATKVTTTDLNIRVSGSGIDRFLPQT